MEYVASHSGFMHWNQQLESISSPKGKGEAQVRLKEKGLLQRLLQVANLQIYFMVCGF